MSWHLAPALDQLRAEVNALWPNRSKASDGTIGDPAHSSRTSDHNPNARGSVNAIDITASGINVQKLINAAKKHPSVRYIIHNRKIMNRDIGNFAPRPYRGSNPHTAHVHISLYQSRAAEQRKQSWGLANAKGGGGSSGGSTYKSVTGSTPLVKLYHKGEPVRRIQSAVGVKVDGYYGPDTVKAVKAFQKKHDLSADGIVGPKTWAKINGEGEKKPAPKPKGTPYPLPKGHFYYTEDKRNIVHSGYWEKDRPAIRKIQRKVGTGVDGGYGAKTKSAVAAWQKKNGLKADGAVGPATWRKMFG
ncbi:peptidoglycan-binding domain-containing protein [Brevibacterium luteolum]|uniref:peptidoglycan-binding domain-containing protein n=1 Tax=Brevibacterium luteolum TaxID=199591 RepID=UPI003B67B8FA